MRRPLGFLIALTLVAGCKTAAPTTGAKPLPKPKPGASSAGTTGTPTTADGGAGLGGARSRLPLDAPPRPLAGDAIAVALTGKVKLISDHGGGIVSNNSGGLVSNNGGGLVSDQGGGLVSNNGGGLTGKTKYALAAAPRAESLLAEAEIEFLDATGQVLVGADQKPLLARTDARGEFRFEGKLPAEGLVARVRLWNGGVLLAMLAKGPAGARTLDLDTATTLGASFVLERFVKKRREVFDRLPAVEAEALRAEIEKARGLLGDRVPDYRPQALLAVADEVSKDAVVSQRLERIKAILLVGQADLGEGQNATSVALSAPIAVSGDAQGNLYVGEFAGGRIRRISKDGRLFRFAGGTVTAALREGPALEVSVDAPVNVVTGADGAVYFADSASSRVSMVKDGQVRVLAGNGNRGQGALEVQATTTELEEPTGLFVTPDGTVYISDHNQNGKPGRFMSVGADGVLRKLESPLEIENEKHKFIALAIAPDGTRFGLALHSRTLWRQKPGGAWEALATQLGINDHSKIQLMPDGDVIVAEQLDGRLLRVKPDGLRVVIAGGAKPGYGGDGGPARDARLAQPTGLWLAPDGALYVTDTGNGLVRKLAPPLDGTGTITTVAGTRGVTQLGDALSISINTPGGVVLDKRGRLVFSEGAGHTIKRLDGSTLSLVAGAGQGKGGDGGPATEAEFFIPTGLAYIGDELYVLESEGLRIRKIDAGGIISTVAGTGIRGRPESGRVKAGDLRMRRPVTCAAGPDGLFYWVDNENNQVYRLTKDGFAEAVVNVRGKEGAGGVPGPAAAAELFRPLGIAFDSKGAMYIADAGNFQIKRVTGLDGPTPQIEVFAGLSFFESLEALGRPEPGGPVPAAEAILMGPTALCFDPDDNLYVTETGTARLPTLLGNMALNATLENVPRRGARIRRFSGVREGKPLATVIAGDGTTTLNTPGTDDSLLVPVGLAIDPARGLYIMDTGNNAIKLLPRGAF